MVAHHADDIGLSELKLQKANTEELHAPFEKTDHHRLSSDLNLHDPSAQAAERVRD